MKLQFEPFTYLRLLNQLPDNDDVWLPCDETTGEQETRPDWILIDMNTSDIYFMTGWYPSAGEMIIQHAKTEEVMTIECTYDLDGEWEVVQ